MARIKYKELICEQCNILKDIKHFVYKRRICMQCRPIELKPPNTNTRLKKAVSILLKSNITKNVNTTLMSYLGCNIQFLREWIEYNKADFNWKEFGITWKISLIFPNSEFGDLSIEENKLLCCNWSNIIPIKIDQIINKDFYIIKFQEFQEESSTTKWFSEKYNISHKI